MVCTINTATYWMAVDANKHVARPVLGPSLGEAEARWEQHMVNDDLRCASSQDHRQRMGCIFALRCPVVATNELTANAGRDVLQQKHWTWRRRCTGCAAAT